MEPTSMTGELLFNQGPFRLIVSWKDVTHAGQQARTVTGYRTRVWNTPVSEKTLRVLCKVNGWTWPQFTDAVNDELRKL